MPAQPETLATVCCALLAGALAWTLHEPSDRSLRDALPGPVIEGGYVGSGSCRACHPGAYEAWHASFHRTMTQPALRETVLASFDGVRLEDRGYVAELSEVAGGFWAELPDPLWWSDADPDKPATAPRIRVRVVMTTGSHHFQNYWIRRPASGPVYRDRHDNGALVQLPFVWLVDEARWIPVQDSFLTPPADQIEKPAVWNSSCHQCHSVGPVPGFREGVFDTRVAELGIACEACHGPAAEHLAAHRSPVSRYVDYFTDEDDETIVQPERLDQDRSGEVCGQCHSFAETLDREGWQTRGVGYRPGQVLAEKRAVLRYEDPPTDPLLQARLAREPDALHGRFWSDGTIRVAGREYNGMIESACFKEGPLDCLSCHSMHAYQDASDQLVPRSIDRVCLDCHAEVGADVQLHTHHAAESSGSDCVNCHMPHTTYGLFGAMRSHRIDSPRVATSAATDRPNACNLCHLDRSLGWAAQWLRDWYGAELPQGEQHLVPTGAQWALAGDAAQRAVTAWHLGWAPAVSTVPEGFAAPLLAALLDDPYAAVRRVAGKALAVQGGFEKFSYDFVSAPEVRRAKSREALGLAPPLAESDRALFESLLSRRDDRPLRIIE